MIQKPICVSCSRYYRPEKNGTPYLEMMPIDGMGRTPPGNEAPDRWTPYKLWIGDLWMCHGCGHKLIVGALHPVGEHYQEKFNDSVETLNPKVKVNDC